MSDQPKRNKRERSDGDEADYSDAGASTAGGGGGGGHIDGPPHRERDVSIPAKNKRRRHQAALSKRREKRAAAREQATSSSSSSSSSTSSSSSSVSMSSSPAPTALQLSRRAIQRARSEAERKAAKVMESIISNSNSENQRQKDAVAGLGGLMTRIHKLGDQLQLGLFDDPPHDMPSFDNNFESHQLHVLLSTCPFHISISVFL